MRPSGEISQDLATPGVGCRFWGSKPTRPSKRADRMWYSGSPVTIWGSRSSGSPELPLWRICWVLPISTGVFLFQQPGRRDRIVMRKRVMIDFERFI